MPIFEYRCKQCGADFETIVRSSTVPACPRCESTELDKQLSVFAVGSASHGHQSLPEQCQGCPEPRAPGGGCCAAC